MSRRREGRFVHTKTEKQIILEMTETEVLNKVSAYCSAAEHCKSEIVEKIQRWGVAYEVINRVVDKLVQENFIDEERYCQAFVNDKVRVAKWGKVKIAEALKLKKIPFYVYRPYIEKIDQEEYLSMLSALLASKKKSVHAATPFELNGKLVRFALSRGFEMKDICHCLGVSEEEMEEKPEA